MQDLSTFGFRGEALSSLCALASLSVTTRTASQSAAVRLTYKQTGELAYSTPAARAVGTTVTVAAVFKPLPVRYKVSSAQICIPLLFGPEVQNYIYCAVQEQQRSIQRKPHPEARL